MNVFQWADAHWFASGVFLMLMGAGLYSVLDGIGTRIGGCKHETCDCPPGCHDDEEEDEEEHT